MHFIAFCKSKKKAILFGPDYVVMSWETYRSMVKQANKENKPLVILDEFADMPELVSDKKDSPQMDE